MKKQRHVLSNILLVLFHLLGLWWIELNCAIKIIFIIEWKDYFDWFVIISVVVVLVVHYMALFIMHKRGIVRNATRKILIAVDLVLPLLVACFVLVPNEIVVGLSLTPESFFIVSIQVAVIILRIVYVLSFKHFWRKN